MKCSKCSTARPVNTTRWTLDGPCSECENTTDPKQEELVERYRELSLLVQQISGEQVEENTFNYLNSWVSGNGMRGRGGRDNPRKQLLGARHGR